MPVKRDHRGILYTRALNRWAEEEGRPACGQSAAPYHIVLQVEKEERKRAKAEAAAR